MKNPLTPKQKKKAIKLFTTQKNNSDEDIATAIDASTATTSAYLREYLDGLALKMKKK